MINKIKSFFHSSMAPNAREPSVVANHKQQLAAAALLIEVLRSDFQARDEEWRAVHAALAEFFDLPNEQIRAIADIAEQEVEKAVSLHGFTRCINDSYSLEEKVKIMQMLWRVALADGVIDKHEQHLMRKIASLLYIPHREYVRSKQQARLHRDGLRRA